MENKTPDPMNELIAMFCSALRNVAEVVTPDANARASLARTLEFQAQALDRAHRTALDFAVNRCETLNKENAELRAQALLRHVTFTDKTH